MVTLVNELSDIVPACNSYDKRKPDKLTILKLAVEHLRSLKSGNPGGMSTVSNKNVRQHVEIMPTN